MRALFMGDSSVVNNVQFHFHYLQGVEFRTSKQTNQEGTAAITTSGGKTTYFYKSLFL